MEKLNMDLAKLRARVAPDNKVDLNTTYGRDNVKTGNIRFINSVNGDMEIDIIGDIGDTLFEDNTKGYTFNKFKEDLEAITTDTITVNIKSRGGDAFEALAIYDALRHFANKGTLVITNIVGTTASAGTIIALAGDIRTITPNSNYLIHKARIQAFANASEMKMIIDGLQEFDGQLVNLYHNVTKLSVEELIAIMDKDEFIPASEAVRLGFCTDILDTNVINKINNFKNKSIMRTKFANILNVAEEEVEATLEQALIEKEELLVKLAELEAKIKTLEEGKPEDEEAQNTIATLRAELDEYKNKEAEAIKAEEEAKEEEEVMNILNQAVTDNKLTNDAIPTWKGTFKTVGKEVFINMINSIPAKATTTDFRTNLENKPVSYQNKAEALTAWKAGKIDSATYANLSKTLK